MSSAQWAEDGGKSAGVISGRSWVGVDFRGRGQNANGTGLTHGDQTAVSGAQILYNETLSKGGT